MLVVVDAVVVAVVVAAVVIVDSRIRIIRSNKNTD